jgi:hypothetical protein
MMRFASAIDTALEARVEVAQPRVICYRVGIRMAEPAMPALLVSHHRPVLSRDRGRGTPALKFGLREAGSQFRGIHGFQVCWNLQKLAMFPFSRHAAQGPAIPTSAH